VFVVVEGYPVVTGVYGIYEAAFGNSERSSGSVACAVGFFNKLVNVFESFNGLESRVYPPAAAGVFLREDRACAL
jgi:hypothetical protein